MDIADRILLLRGDKTREQFVEGLKTSAQTLYKYENRTGKPTIEFVEQVCKKFNIEFAWLISGEGPMRPGEQPQPTANAPEPPVNTPEAVSCARCAKLEAKVERLEEKLEKVELQRDSLAEKNYALLCENGDLREKCATLTERQKTCCPEQAPLLRKPQAPSSEAEARA